MIAAVAVVDALNDLWTPVVAALDPDVYGSPVLVTDGPPGWQDVPAFGDVLSVGVDATDRDPAVSMTAERPQGLSAVNQVETITVRSVLSCVRGDDVAMRDLRARTAEILAALRSALQAEQNLGGAARWAWWGPTAEWTQVRGVVDEESQTTGVNVEVRFDVTVRAT